MYGWKFRSPVLLVTSTYVLISAFYHSMIIKKEPSFWHGTHDLLEAPCPDKGLLCYRCVQLRVLFFQVVTSILDLTFWVLVIFHVQSVHNLSYLEPYQVVRLWEWQWFFCYSELVKVAHVVVGHNNFFPFAFLYGLQPFQQVLQCYQEYLPWTF